MEIDEEFELKFEFNSVINRVRQWRKIFNKSNQMQKKLQNYIVSSNT